MLLVLLAVTLVLLAAGVAMPKAVTLPPAVWAHLVLAVGVMSLITAAMQHFTPVLTRGRPAQRPLTYLPGYMLLAGVLATVVLAGVLDWRLISVAGTLALIGAAVMFGWMLRRSRRALGAPHPGLIWYLGAMGCLVAGLAASVAMPWLTSWQAELRAFHLHINLYGFVGLTAVGTLQVLMPTVVNRAEPEAGPRLRRDFKWALAGTVALAVGKAFSLPPLVWLGFALWLWPLLRLGFAWLSRHGREIVALHGQAPILMAALLGFIAALYAAALQPAGLTGPLAVLLPGFLFPLVSGAAGQLAPVWANPRGQFSAQQQGQYVLARYGGPRAFLFLSAALIPLLGYRCGGMVGLMGLVWFLILFFGWGMRDGGAE
ncbi:MAG: hypothetical protein ACFCUJ_15145 [Thiotrichales bacterium]